MPVGAAIGGGVLAAGGSVAGGILGGNAQRDAAQTAADTSAATTAANNAFLERMYGRNEAHLSPWEQNGVLAGNVVMDALLGFHTPTSPPGMPNVPGSGTNPGSALSGYAGGSQNFTPEQQWAQGAINAMLPNISRSSVRSQLASMSGDPVGALNYLMTLSPPSSDQYPLYQRYVQSNPRPAAGTPAPATGGTGTPAPGTGTPAAGTGTGTGTGTPTSGQTSALSAFDRFRQSTGYNFRLGEGQDMLTGKYGAAGMFQSGAADKALVKYGQDYGSAEFANWLAQLSNQQALGFSASSALAGIGQNYAGSVVASNNANSANQANAALMQGNANANMWGSIGQGLGQVGGIIAQSAYRPPAPSSGGGSYGGWSVMGGT